MVVGGIEGFGRLGSGGKESSRAYGVLPCDPNACMAVGSVRTTVEVV